MADQTIIDELAKKQILDALAQQQPNNFLRPDGTSKGMGWLGAIPGIGENAGNSMTEFSIGATIDGRETLIPSLVPTLTKAEIQLLAEGNDVTDHIAMKAVEHAKSKLSEGKSVWADTPTYQSYIQLLESLKK